MEKIWIKKVMVDFYLSSLLTYEAKETVLAIPSFTSIFSPRPESVIP